MTRYFMTGRQRQHRCTSWTVGKLQTTLHTLGGKAIIWLCR